MTNTETPKVRCGKCSTWDKPVYHDGVAGVRACYMGAPKVAVPAPAPVPSVAVPAPVAPAVVPTAQGRWIAHCTAKGCHKTVVKKAPFELTCHGKTSPAIELVGTLSTKKRKCDSRCTGAVGPVCICSCGGANHGVDHLIGV